MSHPSGRRMLRWPFSIHRLPHLPGSFFPEPHASGQDKSSHDGEITQRPELPPQDGESFRSNAPTSSASGPAYPPPWSKPPSVRYRRYYTQKRRKHLSLLKQRRWLLITLILVL